MPLSETSSSLPALSPHSISTKADDRNVAALMKTLVSLLSKLHLTFIRNMVSKNDPFPTDWKEAALQKQPR